MKIIWQIESPDVQRVRHFYEQYKDTPLVRVRERRNLGPDKPTVTKRQFWRGLTGCLLATQQRSGPHSAVVRFLSTLPFPLRYDVCASSDRLADLVAITLRNFGGLRLYNVIGKQIEANLGFIENGGWDELVERLESLRRPSSPESERCAAQFIAENLRGFGPKQSRNLLQCLGLSSYETPIDSRTTQWLNEYGFPLKLTAKALNDSNYYNFVSDGFQRLSEACGLPPCLLDAAIFSSFDNGVWREDDVVW